MPVRRVLVLSALMLTATGCKGDASAEARMFLDRVERLDIDDPLEERRRLVDNLRTMPLVHGDVTHAREVCVDAHRAIIEAEDLRLEAVGLLAECGPVCAREPGDPEVEGTPDQLRAALALDRNIARAGRAIERSRGLFSRCHRETASLNTRYRHRR